MARKECVCAVCGKGFISYNPTPTYCSRPCKDNHQKHEISLPLMVYLYEKGHTQSEVAELLGTTQKVIYARMAGIKYRPRVAAKRDQFGAENDYWKGGTVTDSRGYVQIKTPEHPRARKCGDYVYEHILVVERYIGRYVRIGEVIHHINGVKHDNRPENLYITDASKHARLHNSGTSHLVKSNLNEFKGVVAI